MSLVTYLICYERSVTWACCRSKPKENNNQAIMLQPLQQDLSESEAEEEAHVDELKVQPGADTTEEAADGVKRCISVAAHVL